jgi:3-methylfumaryl-CoA hydratase
VRPLFDIHRLHVCGRPQADGRVALWARDFEGALAMQAEAHTE